MTEVAPVVLFAGVTSFLGPCRLSSEVCAFLEVGNGLDFHQAVLSVGERIRLGFANQRDLGLAIALTELAFFSSRFGAPTEWFTITGLHEHETLAALRDVARLHTRSPVSHVIEVNAGCRSSDGLSEEEAAMLLCGIRWGGVCIPDAFLDEDERDLARHDRVADEIHRGMAIDKDDLVMAVHMTELAFAGELFGLGCRWAEATGLGDERTLGVLRGLQHRHRAPLVSRRPKRSRR